MTDTTKITDKQILDTLKDVVKENPDYVYANDHRVYYSSGSYTECYYFEADGSPACVVGHVFDRLGVSLEDIGYFNEVSFYDFSDVVFPSISKTTEIFVSSVQRSQDAGLSWGEAYDKSVAEYGDYINED